MLELSIFLHVSENHHSQSEILFQYTDYVGLQFGILEVNQIVLLRWQLIGIM